MVGRFSRWVSRGLVLTVFFVLACGDVGRVVYFDSPSESSRDQGSTSRDRTDSVSPKTDEALGDLGVVPSVEVSSLRAMAVDRVNQRRIELGYSPLKIGDSVAAQHVAEQSLVDLRLLEYTQDGLPIHTVYTATGGRGYMLSSAEIRGYFDEAVIQQCRSALLVCRRTDAAGDLSAYIGLRLAEASPEDVESLLFPDWETLHVGVAYTDFTFVVILQLEHQKITYLKEPSVSGGLLSLELAPYDGLEVKGIDFYHYPPPPSHTASLLRTKVLSIHRPPDSNHILNLPDEDAIVAERWSSDGHTTSIVASIAGRVPGPGVYEVVVWIGSDLPASEYFINVDSTDLQPSVSLMPSDGPEVSAIQELRLFALELINVDRQSHGAPPVRLGSNQAAQLHAEDSVRSGYIVGHWTSNGLKPYMLYTLTGGVGVMAENAAGQRTGSENCDEPRVICGTIDVLSAIATLQWSMMYDDAHANWGHRDTIVDPIYDTVNIGIAFTDSHVAYYQHFEYTRLTHVTTPTLEGGILSLSLQPRTGYEIGNVAIYYDPPPTPKHPEEISSLTSYCVGGGFTDNCENIEPIARVLEPAPPGSYYVDLNPADVVAHLWNVHGDRSVTIKADLRQFTIVDSIYTIVIYSNAKRPELLATYSLTP